ncbi:MAG TPA: hypothetical protein PLL30_07420 [Candidatus Krumholzibacteria bacterium]|nr:hypothetical protein [Candidatus Krumholzibacteria bacterium]HPD71584.1 hypothetical protein [Candidatus Krumholzibacteria bacterium]HRY41483.1 hypothetical protein [Candidatus Krumholzibacteria bacterium]
MDSSYGTDVMRNRRPLAAILVAALLAGGVESSVLRAAPAETRVLIVAAADDSRVAGTDLAQRRQYLLAYRFQDGALAGIDTVVANRDAQLRFNCERSRLHGGRFVLCDTGDIVDLRERRFIFRGGHGHGFSRLAGVEGDLVLIHEPNLDRLTRVNLATGAVTRSPCLPDSTLPGVRSPGGWQSVTHGPPGGGTDELWLHRLDAEPRRLGGGFRLTRSLVSSVAGGGAPLLWLDEQRILTQVDNGEIVVLHTDGRVQPVVTIDLPRSPSLDESIARRPALARERFACMSARLEPDDSGAIVYRIALGPAPDREPFQAYVIDVEAKTYTTLDPDWRDLGHEFASARHAGEDRWILRHRGEAVAEVRFALADQATAPEAIAIVERAPGEPDAIAIWFSASDRWTRIPVAPGWWLPPHALVGWLPAAASSS